MERRISSFSSTITGNHQSKRQRFSSPLSNVTNVTVNSKQPGQHRRTQLLEKSFIDLNDNNLFENTISYGSDVPVDIIGLSKTTSSVNTHHLISSGTFNQVDSLFDSPLSDITNV
ncbi:hypothetical protein CASFOL_000517 [Castilleja foliolosa]|uniref:Uncharacterized protein n=1 Tax=Castilleja foliolosa TaxID=1961234 RepID=A0ABD3EPH4_9LAMI